jgi:hypothetical protein
MKLRKKVLLNFVKVTATLTLLLSLLLRQESRTTEWGVLSGAGDGGEDPRWIGDRGSNMLTEKHEIIFLRNYAQGHEDAWGSNDKSPALEVVSGQFHAAARQLGRGADVLLMHHAL